MTLHRFKLGAVRTVFDDKTHSQYLIPQFVGQSPVAVFSGFFSFRNKQADFIRKLQAWRRQPVPEETEYRVEKFEEADNSFYRSGITGKQFRILRLDSVYLFYKAEKSSLVHSIDIFIVLMLTMEIYYGDMNLKTE